MRRHIKIIAVAFCLFASVFVAQAWAMGGGHGGPSQGGGGGCSPEIDPGVASSAIALLSCGVLILTSKRR